MVRIDLQPSLMIDDEGQIERGGYLAFKETTTGPQLEAWSGENLLAGWARLSAEKVGELALWLVKSLDREKLYDFELEILRELQRRQPGGGRPDLIKGGGPPST